MIFYLYNKKVILKDVNFDLRLKMTWYLLFVLIIVTFVLCNIVNDDVFYIKVIIYKGWLIK